MMLSSRHRKRIDLGPSTDFVFLYQKTSVFIKFAFHPITGDANPKSNTTTAIIWDKSITRSNNNKSRRSQRIIFIQTKFMVDIGVHIPSAFDPFAEVDQDSGGGAGIKEYVHIRIQQRNGRKSLTTVQGLKKELSYEKILKDLKKEFCCNGTVVQDKELGKVIQLQGDQRKNVSAFLTRAGIVKKDQIKIHGF
ncbi:unnamed protein product [Lactuca saligna]|uniref:SUI1 domain-containing protein n=2 Tax=Lactuca TaxID=4235 RepID=A0AA35Z080_LACSI|nr:unnamed protein product [Lactuca saligna]